MTVIPTLAPVQVVLEDLAACLCAQITIDDSIEPCFCGVMPGAAIPIDVGTCDQANGMAYARLVSTYPSAEVGVANLTPGNCAVGTGIDLELGIYRCYPLEEDGTAPPPDVMLEATRLQVADEQTMRRALSCGCWLSPKDFVTGQYAPAGPAGGVLGGVIPISAWIP